MALRDLDKLINADKKAKDIEDKIDRELNPGLRADIDGSQIGRAQRQFELAQEINEEMRELSNSVAGGIQNRIDSSLKFFSYFRQIVPHLSQRKIFTFQSYEEFMQRRLYRIETTIEQLGRRLERIRVRTAQIVDNSEFAQENENLQKTNDILDRTRKLIKAAHSIEIFAVSYYLGSILDKTFIAMKPLFGEKKMLSDFWSIFPRIEISYLWYPLAFVAWAMIREPYRNFALGLIRKRKPSDEGRQKDTAWHS